MDRTRQKINKKTENMNNTKNQIDLGDIYRKSHPSATTEYALFSSTHGTFCRTNHRLGHKTDLNKFQRIEIKQSTCSNYNRMDWKPVIKRNLENSQMWKLNNICLNNEWEKRNHKINQKILGDE